MKIELLGAIDYEKLLQELKNRNVDNSKEIIELIKELERYERTRKVSTAGRLSRFSGDIFEVLGLSSEKTFEQNTNFAKRVIGMGHNSIIDHDYLVFAIKDVSPVIEQTIIEERFSSFTIKSRREVDFSKAGFYTPDFHGKDGKTLKNNKTIQTEYRTYMSSLFEEYEDFIQAGVTKEDARFILPYCYHSNILMGVDAHTLVDMIREYTKGKLSKIQEIREFGERLYEIVKENIPYLIELIDDYPETKANAVETFLSDTVDIPEYRVLDHPVLLSRSHDVDETILVSSIMHLYQINAEQAKKVLDSATEKDPTFRRKLMRKIMFRSDGKELHQVHFQYQIPISLAVLTHLTRHRTHHILTPDFAPNIDLTQYKIPPKLEGLGLTEKMDEVFDRNYEMYKHFKKDYGICDEDLIYFTLSGNTVNVMTSIDGWTLAHVLRLRECTKAQWEIRNVANGMHKELTGKDLEIFTSLLGPTCMTQRICNEGKESCGKVLKLEPLPLEDQDY